MKIALILFRSPDHDASYTQKVPVRGPEDVEIWEAILGGEFQGWWLEDIDN